MNAFSPVTIYLILGILAMVFLVLHVVRGFPIWPTVLILILISLISLTSCAINEDGDPYIQTPRLNVPVAFLGDSTLWGYGVIGISHPKLHANVSRYDGKAIVPAW